MDDLLRESLEFLKVLESHYREQPMVDVCVQYVKLDKLINEVEYALTDL